MAFEWPIDRSVFPALPAPDAPEYVEARDTQRAAAQLAVDVLYALSGRQFGLLDQTVRPCRQPFRHHHGSGPVTSYLLSWEGNGWWTVPCGCWGACRLSGPNVIHLPGPVHGVTEVTIAGVVLSPLVWVLENDRLYRRETAWPPQDMNRPLGDPNTWSVTYQRGIVPPEGTAALTGLLAKEFLDAVTNEGRCRLPRTVTTASRNGVTYRAYDPAVIYANGKTGLPEVDMWLATVNPNHLMAAPSVI